MVCRPDEAGERAERTHRDAVDVRLLARVKGDARSIVKRGKTTCTLLRRQQTIDELDW
jgi:hypothetical protein